MDLKAMTTDEILAQNPRWSYNRTDRNGTRYFVDSTCPRCGGRGIIPCYGDIDGGICFECGGAGVAHRPQEIKVYTPEHEAKLAADREKRAQARHNAKLADFKAHMADRLKELGFGIEDGIAVCYRVTGNTYPIKDQLKELGCKFNPMIGWYASRALEGYECQRMLALELCHFNEETVAIEWFDRDQVLPLLIENQRARTENISEWQGEIGDRLELTLTIDRVFEGRGFRDGINYLYIMHDENGNCFTWSTGCCYTGDTMHIKGTVKDHTEYNNKQGVTIKQTVLTRCTKIKEN